MWMFIYHTTVYLNINQAYWTVNDWCISDQQDGMVVAVGNGRPWDIHQENKPWAKQTVGSGRWDARPCREDDVWPATAGVGQTHFRWAEKTGYDSKVSIREFGFYSEYLVVFSFKS